MSTIYVFCSTKAVKICFQVYVKKTKDFALKFSVQNQEKGVSGLFTVTQQKESIGCCSQTTKTNAKSLDREY